MEFMKKSFSVFVTLVLLGLLGLSTYFAVSWIIGSMWKLEVIAINERVISSLCVLLAATIVARAIRQADRQERPWPVLNERVATYQFFVDVWVSLLQPGLRIDANVQARLSSEKQALNHSLGLYGSPSVVQSHLWLTAMEARFGLQHPDLKSQLACTLLEIRKDLGMEVKGLAAETLVELLFAESSVTKDLGKVPQPGEVEPLRASLFSDLRPSVTLKAFEEVG